jgi:hypothetical protein
MYWPPLIDSVELMIAPASLAASNTMARAISLLAGSIDVPCDQSSLVRDQLVVTNSISASHNDQALALSFDSVRCPDQWVLGLFR